jgi:hypothetical protein
MRKKTILKKISVEKTILGAQLNLVGVSVFNKLKLTNSNVLKSEFGLRANILIENSNSDFFLQPQIVLQPRWYYNSAKRPSKGKNTEKNSGNFISFYNSYNTDWFSVINEDDNKYVTESISSYLLWGLKRSYGKRKHFHLEFAAGFGYYKELNLPYYFKDDSGFYPALDFRFGYQF